MRFILILFLITGVTLTNLQAQNLDSLEARYQYLTKKIDSLERIIRKTELLRDSLDNEGELIQAKIRVIEEKEFTKTGIKTKIGYLPVELRKAPFGEKFLKIESGEEVSVIGAEDNFVKIIYKDVTGFVGRHYVVETPELVDFLNNENPRLSSLIKRFGETDGRRIYAGKIWLDMSTSEARESLGRPKDINTSTGSWGTHSQWIYHDKYLYFENGKLTSWQD